MNRNSLKKNYSREYKSKIFKVNYPPNLMTRIFLSRFSPFKDNFKRKKILDYSCGSGPYLQFFIDLGFKVFATEISKKIIDQLCKRYPRVNFSEGNNRHIKFKKNYFDYIFCNHSIYYLTDKNDNITFLVENLRDSLKRNGYLICTFPLLNQKHIKFKLVKNNIYRVTKDKYKLRQNNYLYLFRNARSIRNYFIKFFKVIELGRCRTKFKNFDEDYFVLILKKM